MDWKEIKRLQTEIYVRSDLMYRKDGCDYYTLWLLYWLMQWL